MPSIYIINPSASPGYHTSEFFCAEDGTQGWVQVADLTVATLAAFVPAGWTIRLTDEGISPADLSAEVDFVAITGKVSQRNRMIELAREFRRRGRVVLIGGSFASLTPDDMRPHADILVTGELEDIASRLFADLASGRWSDLYEGGQADVGSSPVPRWDLYPVERALAGALQTSRGCPFNCEFCDVIQYQGRKQRFKSTEQVVKELDALYQHGFRRIFLVDDNFTVQRRRAHAILDALIEWNNQRSRDPVSFLTQASLDVARDPDLLAKCREARLQTLFVGIETINPDSLRETGKKQNLLMPIRDAVARIVGSGVSIQAGVILGFDHDDAETFEQLVDFFDSAPLPDLSIGVLTAPRKTDLYRRLTKEGRIVSEVWEATAGHPFSTNIVPQRMTRAELLNRTKDFCELMYRADIYEKRLLTMIETFGDDRRHSAHGTGAALPRRRMFSQMLDRIAALGEAERRMVASALRAGSRKPAVLPIVMNMLGRYGQARLVLDQGRWQSLAAA